MDFHYVCIKLWELESFISSSTTLSSTHPWTARPALFTGTQLLFCDLLHTFLVTCLTQFL